MDVYDTIGAILDSEGKIRGKSAIQKLVYLAKVKIPKLDIPEYKPHYFGPYSPKVEMSLEKMISYLFILETAIPGAKSEKYSYELTNDGKKIVKLAREDQGEQYDMISNMVKTCSNVCGLDASSLSVATKIMQEPNGPYLISNDGLEAIKQDWGITDEQIGMGVELLKELQVA